MSSSSNYDTGSTPFIPGRNVVYNQIRVKNGSIAENLDVNTINGQPYPPGITGMSGGAINTFLMTDSSNDVVWNPFLLNYVPHGTTGQMISSSGTGAFWSSNPRIPGTLTVDGSTTLKSNSTCEQGFTVDGILVVDGAVTFGSSLTCATGPFITWNNSSGVTGQVLYSYGTELPCFWDDLPAQNNLLTCKYYDNNVVNMNGGASVLLFAAASPDYNSTANVVYTAGALGGFAVAKSGLYSVEVNILASTAVYQTQINLMLNSDYKGSIRNYYDGVNTNPQYMYLTRTIYCNANDVIKIVSEPIVAGVVNTSGADNHGISTSDITIIWLANN